MNERSVNMSKYRVCIFSFLLTIMLLLASCSPNKSIDEANVVNNNERNIVYNGGNALLRTDDALYYRKLISKTNNSDFSAETHQEIFRIDNTGITKVYSGKSQGENDWNFYPDLFIYNNELLNGNPQPSSKTGITEIQRLNSETKQFEKYLEIESPDGNQIHRILTLNNELYLFTDSDDNNIYKYKDGNCVLIYSQKLFKTSSLELYDNYMYYTVDKDDYDKYKNIYKYDLSEKKNIKKLDFSGLKEIFSKPQYGANKTCILDNYLYVDYTENGQSDGYHHFYRLDISKNSSAELYSGKDSFILNGYGTNAYLGFSDGDNAGLYLAKPDSNSLVKLCSKEISSVFIVDDKWIYFGDINDTLYRILPNGENLEKIL